MKYSIILLVFQFFILTVKKNFFAVSEVKVNVHKNWHLVNPPNCGVSNPFKSRIIGGRNAELGEYPWIVQLFMSSYKGAGDESFICAGNIINEKYVVTASHCFIYYSMVVEYVRAGDYNVETDPDCFRNFCAPPFIDYDVAVTIRHANFGKQNFFENDITLIRIKGKFIFNAFLTPICLPLPYGKLETLQYTPGKQLKTIGWGVSEQTQSDFGVRNETFPDILQVLPLYLVDKEHCETELKINIPESQLCAGGTEGTDTCLGDSGGPLMEYTWVNNTSYESINYSERYFLIGITSYGLLICARNSIPAIYTRVDHHMEWILNHMYE